MRALGSIRRGGNGGKPGEQVVAGGYLLKLDSGLGARVSPSGAGGQAGLRERPGPVLVRPPRFPNLIGRSRELKAVEEILPLSPALEFYGPPGSGKTSLLRYLAHQPFASGYRDGIIYLEAVSPLEDLLLSLFRAFYEEEPGRLVDPALMRSALSKKRALVLLDDLALTAEEVNNLLGCLPESAFLLASETPRLLSAGGSLPLDGLPLADMVQLAGREIGRPLTEDERTAVQSLHSTLGGYPGQILQAAALARDSRRTLADIVWQLPPGPFSDTLGSAVLASLSSLEGQIVAAVACLDGAPAEEEHLAEFLNLPGAIPILNTLIRRNILQAHSPRYTLAGGLEQVIRDSWDLDPWRERFLDYLSGWAGGQRHNPARVIEAARAILSLGAWAAAAGRWERLLELVRAVEPAFILEGHWGAWERLLGWAQQAGQALNDPSARAWAFHQLGTLALCRGEGEEARSNLVRALRLREAEVDANGAAQSRHNLSYLLGTAPARGPLPPPVREPQGAATRPLAARPLLTRPSPAAAAPATGLAVIPPPASRPALFNPAPWVAAGLLGSCLLFTLVVVGIYFWGDLGGGPPIAALPSPTGAPTTPFLPDTGSTQTDTATLSPPLSATPCGPPVDWPVYVVQPGDSLVSIAIATGSTEAQLRSANCMDSPVVALGQQLFVPRLPGPTPAPSATFTQAPAPSETPVTPRPPDLTVSSLQAGPYVSVNAQGEFVLPVQVSVLNGGSSPAGDFKVSLSYRRAGSNPGPEVVAPFQVPGQSDPSFPHSVNDLPPGSQVSFDGQALISAQQAGQTISLWAWADSCAGEVNPPANCRVAESNENNNLSGPVLLLLPELPAATPTATLTQPPTQTPPAPSETPVETRVPPVQETPTRLPPESSGQLCLDFEDLSLGETYPISNVILTSNFPLVVAPLASSPEDVSGTVQVGAENGAGGSGLELALSRASLRLLFDPDPPIGLSLQLSAAQGPVEVVVNGEARQAQNLAELQGQLIGGASIVVFDPEADGTGSLDFTGAIHTFEVGGPSLWVDHICPRFASPRTGLLPPAVGGAENEMRQGFWPLPHFMSWLLGGVN